MISSAVTARRLLDDTLNGLKRYCVLTDGRFAFEVLRRRFGLGYERQSPDSQIAKAFGLSGSNIRRLRTNLLVGFERHLRAAPPRSKSGELWLRLHDLRADLARQDIWIDSQLRLYFGLGTSERQLTGTWEVLLATLGFPRHPGRALGLTGNGMAWTAAHLNVSRTNTKKVAKAVRRRVTATGGSLAASAVEHHLDALGLDRGGVPRLIDLAQAVGGLEVQGETLQASFGSLRDLPSKLERVLLTAEGALHLADLVDLLTAIEGEPAARRSSVAVALSRDGRFRSVDGRGRWALHAEA